MKSSNGMCQRGRKLLSHDEIPESRIQIPNKPFDSNFLEFEIGHIKVAVTSLLKGSQECGRLKARVPRNTGGVYVDIRRGFPRDDNAEDAVLLRTA